MKTNWLNACEQQFPRRSWMWLSLAAMVWAGGSEPLAGAQRAPEVGYVFPAGGQQGATIQVAMAGRYLTGATNVVVSGAGLSATVLEHVRPLNGKEINLLRDRQKAILAQLSPGKAGKAGKASGRGNPSATTKLSRTKRAALQKELAQIKKKLSNPKNRNRNNPQLAEDLRLRLTIAADAKPGVRELRVRTATGLSNPLRFHVGQLPECREQEPNDQAVKPQLPAEPPLVFNGQIQPGDVDRFRLKLRQGTRLVATAQARELIPYLADAVPGWFQATLTLYDAQGHEVAYDDDFQFHPDPVLFYEVPKDGNYVLAIQDAIYRGREDFVYRITVGELPFITSAFPLGGSTQAPTTVALEGWNLPRHQMVVKPNGRAPSIRPITVGAAERVSNPIPFALDPGPECLEQEPNNAPADAQRVKPDIIINGRIDPPGDWDVFEFNGRAGQALVAEVYARRLNSPLDSVLKLMDPDGREWQVNDDYEDKTFGLLTHQADSKLQVTLPKTGAYRLYLGDIQQKGGPAYGYRLHIRPPQPNFALRLAPSTLNARAGSTVPFTVYAFRTEGFSNTISLVLEDAPAGFVLNGQRLPANKDQVRCTLRVPRQPSPVPLSVRLAGRATINGKQVTHPVVPADDEMQAFIYHHLVPAQDCKVTVIGRPKGKAAIKKLAKKTGKPAKNRKPKTE